MKRSAKQARCCWVGMGGQVFFGGGEHLLRGNLVLVQAGVEEIEGEIGRLGFVLVCFGLEGAPGWQNVMGGGLLWQSGHGR